MRGVSVRARRRRTRTFRRSICRTRSAGAAFYEPGAFGFEKEIAKRLAWWAEHQKKADREREDTES